MPFETTVWQLIYRAKADDPHALNEFVSKYSAPVTQFLARSGCNPHDAEDLTQEVFLRIFKDRILEKADRLKGRFRSFLLAVSKHVMLNHRQQSTAIKRGSGKPVFSLDELAEKGGDQELGSILGAHEQDEQFDREWMRHLFGRALSRLEREHPLNHAILQATLQGDKTYQQIAKDLGKTEVDIWNGVRAAKQMMVRLVREAIAEYSSSQEEFQAETDYLSRYLEA